MMMNWASRRLFGKRWCSPSLKLRTINKIKNIFNLKNPDKGFLFFYCHSGAKRSGVIESQNIIIFTVFRGMDEWLYAVRSLTIGIKSKEKFLRLQCVLTLNRVCTAYPWRLAQPPNPLAVLTPFIFKVICYPGVFFLPFWTRHSRTAGLERERREGIETLSSSWTHFRIQGWLTGKWICKFIRRYVKVFVSFI